MAQRIPATPALDDVDGPTVRASSAERWSLERRQELRRHPTAASIAYEEVIRSSERGGSLFDGQFVCRISPKVESTIDRSAWRAVRPTIQNALAILSSPMTLNARSGLLQFHGHRDRVFQEAVDAYAEAKFYRERPGRFAAARLTCPNGVDTLAAHVR
jgi:hypothetical protein